MKNSRLLLLVALFLIGIVASCSKGGGTNVTPKNPDPPVVPVLSIKNFTPASAKIGATVTITGSAFGNDASVVTIKFGSSGAINPATIKDSLITVIVPPDATNGAITIGINNKSFITSNSLFTVIQTVDPPIDYSGYNKIEFTGTATLSQARQHLAGAGDKILFGGGTTGAGTGDNEADSGYSDVVDIYSISTNTWSVAHLSEARCNLAAAAAGNKVVFAGGYGASTYSKTVDIYDVKTNQWSTSELSIARSNLTATASGTKIYFAGGTGDGDAAYRIDIYDAVSGTWTTKELTRPAASGLGSAYAGGKVAFAGGYGQSVNDIFVESTFEHDAIPLTGDKSRCVGAGLGNKIIFTGVDKTADILNTSTPNIWTASSTSVSKYECAAAAGGTKILFGGGFDTHAVTYSPFKAVDVYDIVTDTWNTLQLSQGRGFLAGAASANKIIFAGGNSGTAVSNTVDIFTISK